MAPLKYLCCLLPIVLATSCKNSHHETKYLYTKPEAVVFDLYYGEAEEMNTVSYTSHLVTMMMHTSEFSYTKDHSFSLINKAYATQPDYYGLKKFETITDIKIISLHDYNSVLTAGTDIADSCIFGLHDAHHDTSWYMPIVKDSLTKADIISALNTTDNSKYNDTFNPLSPLKRFSFHINQPPAQSGKQQFAILFETNTPSRFGDTTVSFILKP